MENFLVRIIDPDGKEIWNDMSRLNYTHLDSFKEFSKKNNLAIPLSSDQDASLSMASMNYVSILNFKVGYAFYLPEVCSEKQIDRLENDLELYRQEEQNDKMIIAAIYSKDKVYYNHENYRDLQLEEHIKILEGKKKNKNLVTDLLREELTRQKEISKETTSQL